VRVRPPTLERPTEAEGPTSPEVLFREARRRRHRRWIVGSVAIAAVVGGAAAAYGTFGTGTRRPSPPSSAGRQPKQRAAVATRTVCADYGFPGGISKGTPPQEAQLIARLRESGYAIVTSVRPDTRSPRAATSPTSNDLPPQNPYAPPPYVSSLRAQKLAVGVGTFGGVGACAITARLESVASASAAAGQRVAALTVGTARIVWNVWLIGPWGGCNQARPPVCTMTPKELYNVAIDAKTGRVLGAGTSIDMPGAPEVPSDVNFGPVFPPQAASVHRLGAYRPDRGGPLR
jgi:hypothetical protein